LRLPAGALGRVRLSELPNYLLLLLKKPSEWERAALPDVREVAPLLSRRLNFKLLKPAGGREGEARLLSEGAWRAAGKWVKGCSCSPDLGYPCYERWAELFDVRSCFSFSPKVHYLTVPVAPTKGADVKYPWFFTRAYHFARGAVLGVSPPREFFRLVKPYSGPGWANAMEAGLRALNLTYSFGNNQYSVEIVEQLLAALLYILVNVEVGVYTSNHTMCDLYGLTVSSLALGRAWRPLARAAWEVRESLVYELRKQLDGWDYEGSTAYHLLVLEGALATLYAAKELDESYFERVWPEVKGPLSEASELLASVTLPDSSFPLIGDNGSDRALVLESLEFDYTSTITALALARKLGLLKSFPKLEGPAKEEAARALSSLGGTYPEERALRTSDKPWLHSYNDGELLVTLACAPTSKGAPPGHHHDDKGSFTVWRKGWVVLDPGTFTYTGMKEVKDLMRSSYFHDVLRGCCTFPDTFDASCNCTCKFYGYMKVEVFPGWRREVYVKKDRVVIKDVVDFKGSMSLVLPSRPEQEGDYLELPNARIKVPGAYEVTEAFYSPSYGVIKKGYLVRVRDVGPGEATTEVVF